ncbi:hypothetical protein Nmel_016112 [Mimus melanotis]
MQLLAFNCWKKSKPTQRAHLQEGLCEQLWGQLCHSLSLSLCKIPLDSEKTLIGVEVALVELVEVIQCNPDGGDVPGASSPPAKGPAPLLAEELREVQGSSEGHSPSTFPSPSCAPVGSGGNNVLKITPGCASVDHGSQTLPGTDSVVTLVLGRSGPSFCLLDRQDPLCQCLFLHQALTSPYPPVSLQMLAPATTCHCSAAGGTSAVSHRYLDTLEQALAAGDLVLIENLEESVDPVLGPLLGRETIKKGR